MINMAGNEPGKRNGWFASSSMSQPITAGSRGRNLRQIPWKNTAHWLALSGLLVLLSYITRDHLAWAWHCQQWSGFSLINHKSKHAPKIGLQASLMEETRHLRFPLPRWPSFCQVDKKPPVQCRNIPAILMVITARECSYYFTQIFSFKFMSKKF